MRYFSLFSGIGGFENGIKKAGRKLGIEFKCVGYSEIDKYADAVYKRHFAHKNFGDAKAIRTEQLPDFDLLVAGFPCQPFSIAGKRRGFNEARGTLFFDIVRVLKDKRPRHFLLENVKGLLSHRHGETFQTMLRFLTAVGYSVEWAVLNSKDYGLSQSRERTYIVGCLGKGCPREILYKRQKAENKVMQIGIISEKDTMWGRVYSPEGVSVTLRALGGGLGAKSGLYLVNGRIRRLTPLECERLQGFPDNWTKYGVINGQKFELSDTQRYKLLGNAVSVNVVEQIILNMFKGGVYE